MFGKSGNSDGTSNISTFSGLSTSYLSQRSWTISKYSCLVGLEKRTDKPKRWDDEGLPVSLPYALQFGSSVMAAYTAASKVIQLVMQPLIIYGVSTAILVGQNLGAGLYERIFL